MGADPDAEVDARRDHRLERLAAALRVEHLERQAMLLEEAGVLAELRDALLPAAALADRDLERVVGAGRGRKRQQHSDRQHPPDPGCRHRALPRVSFPPVRDVNLGTAEPPARYRARQLAEAD